MTCSPQTPRHPHWLVMQMLVAMLLLTACLQMASGRPMSPAEHCGFTQPQTLTDDMVEVEVWARAYGHYCWRAFGPALAAARVTDDRVYVTSRAYETLDAPYRQAFVQAAEMGSAPDIAYAPGPAELLNWAQSGYIIPFDDCRTGHREFATVFDGIGSRYLWQGKIWGAPLEIRLLILFFNKHKLRELGWTEQQIGALPDQIRVGDFTLEHLFDTAQQAVRTGIVPVGFGYWPSINKADTFELTYATFGGHIYSNESGKLMIDQNILTQVYAFQHKLVAQAITLDHFASKDLDSWANRVLWRDAVAHGRVLFWTAFNYDWANWRMNNGVEEAQMHQMIGYALFPAAYWGNPGTAWWHSTGFYAITTETASGRTHQDEACAVIAQSLSPEINALNAAKAGMLGVLQSPTDAHYTASRFVAETHYMWDYRSGRAGPVAGDRIYREITSEYMVAVERGELLPAVASAAAVQQLQSMLGDNIIVE